METSADKKNPPLRKPVFTTIGALDPESRTVNLICKVVNVKTVLDVTRNDGSKMKISEAEIADTSGSMTLTCRTEEHFGIVLKGVDLIIRNASVRMFKGFMRLHVDKWGVIEKYDSKWGYEKPPEQADLKLDNDISAVEYEEVPDPQRSEVRSDDIN
ncbi:hypothetical protein AAMO2058_000216800 [Amorphochlora amoebiformis]|eukprot:1392821-Amorphochlora_amoeboformis.AAC.1